MYAIADAICLIFFSYVFGFVVCMTDMNAGLCVFFVMTLC